MALGGGETLGDRLDLFVKVGSRLVEVVVNRSQIVAVFSVLGPGSG